MELRFSVIIPVLDLRGSLDLLMRCLEAQTFPRTGFECIIVDDGSTDGSAEFLDAYAAGFNLRVVHHSRTLGRSSARNIGCRHAQGDILVFLDGDMLPRPSWLSEYDRAFRTRDADVLSGGRYSIAIDPRYAPTQLSARLKVPIPDLFRFNVAEQFDALSRRARLGQYPTPLYERLEIELDDICREFPSSVLCAFSFITSNVAVYRASFDKTHGFCSFIVRLQDTELGLQLWEAGCRFGFVRSAAAYHLFYPVSPDLATNYNDVMSMFYRHPYTVVLAMACWGLHRAPIASKRPLRELAQCTAADLDIAQEFRETFNQPLPTNCQYTLDDVIEYAAEQSRLPREEIRRSLQRGIAHGLCAHAIEGRVVLDRHHTVNWLQNNTLFREADLRQSCCVNNLSVLQHTGSPEAANAFLCHGRYEVTVPRDLFATGTGQATIHLPLPVRHARQTNLHVQPFRSDGVTECGSEDHLAFAWHVGATAGDVVVGYEFTCDLHETTVAAADVRSGEDLRPFQRTMLPEEYIAKAEALLRQIPVDPADATFLQARALYIWILDHYAFRESTRSTVQVFETGAGPCTHAAKLFVELCRLLGIPAREQCGALLQKVVASGETQTVETLERGYSPFMHTWAEFHDPQRGWVSVEFLGWMLGARTLTTRNVADTALRSSIQANTPLYDRYFFGHLDPFRVRSAATSNRLRTYPILTSDPSWPSIHRATFATRHRLTCTLTQHRPARMVPAPTAS